MLFKSISIMCYSLMRLFTFISLVTNLKFSLTSLEITHHIIITSSILKLLPRFTSTIQVTVKS